MTRCGLFPPGLERLLVASMTASSAGRFESITRQHGIRINTSDSVEKCSLAVGELVGHEKIVSAARMNNAVVLFLEKVEWANALVQSGIGVGGEYLPVLPLSTPAKKVIISNVPPFVKDEILLESLARHGKIVSPIKKIGIASKNPLLKHVVSFRRFLYMIIEGDRDLELTINVKVEGVNHVVYATTHIMQCFGCGETGHLVRNCPKKRPAPDNAEGQPSQSGAPSEGGGEREENPEPPEQPQTDTAPPAQSQTEMTTASPDPVVSAESVGDHGNDEMELNEAGFSQDSENPTPVVAEDGSIGFDDALFKAPHKRKGKSRPRRQAKKSTVLIDLNTTTDAESEGEASDCSVRCTLRQSGFPECSYTVDDIKAFLVKTKYARDVQIDEHFPDVEQFLEKTEIFIAEGGFDKLEVSRLKRILGKLRLLLGKNV